MSHNEEYQAIRDIADSICEEQVTPEQIKQLEALLKGDPEAKRFYLDYMEIHTYLSSAAQSNMEVVYRRIQTAEEVIVRPTGEISTKKIGISNLNSSESSQKSIETLTPNNHDNLTLPNNKKIEPSSFNWLAIKVGCLSILLCLLAVVLTWYFIVQTSEPLSAEINHGSISGVKLGQVSGPVIIGEYKVNQDAILTLANGEVVNLVKNSIFKLTSSNEIELKRGAVLVKTVAKNKFFVRGPNFTLYTTDREIGLDLRADNPIVSADEQTMIIPDRWRPQHYWPFEGQTDRAIDLAGTADGVVYEGAIRTQGLIGRGAYSFDNSFDARIDVGSGGGTVPASGSFAVTDGVTIEALVKPRFSGKTGDMDEIFRKDQSDKELRMLLSFQKDKIQKSYLMPDGYFKNKETLGFGLYLLGQGYQELKLPLDGLEGRPTLASLKDGNSHHIVATYNVETGIKAIYLNGKRLAFYQYPPGSKMLSGGAGAANIGNSPNIPAPIRETDVRYANNEAFSGIIDEVAFYNFALPQYMVEEHFYQFKQGVNYYGLFPSTDVLPNQIELKLPSNSRVELEHLTGLPRRTLSK